MCVKTSLKRYLVICMRKTEMQPDKASREQFLMRACPVSFRTVSKDSRQAGMTVRLH